MKVIFRVIVSPLVFALGLFHAGKNFLIWFYCYLRYGGEIISYKEKFNPQTIGDKLEKLLKD